VRRTLLSARSNAVCVMGFDVRMPELGCVGGDQREGCLREARMRARVRPATEPVSCLCAVFAWWNISLWYLECMPMSGARGQGGIATVQSGEGLAL
jgi:hypothetical protein